MKRSSAYFTKQTYIVERKYTFLYALFRLRAKGKESEEKVQKLRRRALTEIEYMLYDSGQILKHLK